MPYPDTTYCESFFKTDTLTSAHEADTHPHTHTHIKAATNTHPHKLVLTQQIKYSSSVFPTAATKMTLKTASLQVK